MTELRLVCKCELISERLASHLSSSGKWHVLIDFLFGMLKV